MDYPWEILSRKGVIKLKKRMKLIPAILVCSMLASNFPASAYLYQSEPSPSVILEGEGIEVTVPASTVTPAAISNKIPLVSTGPSPLLNLQFENNLSDTGTSNTQSNMEGTGYGYVEGVKENSKALNLQGNTYLNMGNGSALNPANLTVSFWVNPAEVMNGEQIFVWNKEEWYTDGWYLASESQDIPLSISIGKSDVGKQPYKVGVAEISRDELFPLNTWTHISVTFNKDTKEVNFFKNGMQLPTVVLYHHGIDGATGAIDQGNTMQKALGYNGPKYKGSFLKAALDEFKIYEDTLSQEDVRGVYTDEGGQLDEAFIVDSDMKDIELPGTTTKNLDLPAFGKNGSTIVWESMSTDIISDNGEISLPENVDASEGILKAKISYGNVTKEKEFRIVVTAVKEILQDSGMGQVTLMDDYLMNASDKGSQYLLDLSSKKFLYEFYKVAGLKPVTESGYSGWERSNDTNFRGHTLGHYMSALSQAYLSSHDMEEKGKLLEQIKDAVNGLKECQDAYSNSHPQSAGYISAFRESALDKVQGTGGSNENVLVPWYNLHKVLAGLIDISKNVEDDMIHETALEVAKGFGDYIYTSRTSTWSDTTKEQMLRIEYGGMNEALYELYNMTGNENYKQAAQCFDEMALFQELYKNNDVLSGKHANTTIPKLIGALKRYTVLSQDKYYSNLSDEEKKDLPMYLTAAQNFWQIVVNNHTYVTGGNSQSEHFRNPNTLAKNADNKNCETCNTYNMLKLTRELFKLTREKKYADYYETTYLNAIVSSQNPETGMMMYFQPMAPGYYKLYNSKYDSFWCCTGTGMESFSKLDDSIYFTDSKSIYINMYESSEFNDINKNVKVTQEANLPNSDKIVITVRKVDEGLEMGKTNIYLRIPDWVAKSPTLSINGETKEVNSVGGYIIVNDVKDGDVIEFTLPMKVVYHELVDNPNMIAFKYGPVVLSASLGTKDLDKTEGAGIIVYAPALDRLAATTINLKSDTIAEWKDNIANNLIRIEDSKDGKVQFQLKGTDKDDTLRYTPHYAQHKERYGLYMYLTEPDSVDFQNQILEKKVEERNQETSSDFITNFDENNTEYARNLKKSDDSSVGSYNGRQYRDAKKNGWFSYDLLVNIEADKNYLLCTYTKDDKGRSFDIYLNDEKFVTETINPTGQVVGSDGFYTIKREIPTKYLTTDLRYRTDSDGIQRPAVNIKFQSTGGLVGGLFGVNVNTDYDTNPDLLSLSFSAGKLDKEFSGKETLYKLTVDDTLEAVSMKALPFKNSGLIYADGVLIDDTQERIVKLKQEITDLTIISKAQDHKTQKEYHIQVVKEKKKEVPSESGSSPDTNYHTTIINNKSGVLAVVKVQPTLKEDNTRVANISDVLIKDALRKAKEYTQKDGGNKEITVEIRVVSVDNAAALNENQVINLNQYACQSLIEAKVKTLDIITGNVAYSIPLKTLSNMYAKSQTDLIFTSSVIKNIHDQLSKTTKAVSQKAIGNRPVYDISISYKDEQETKYITNLDENSMKIIIPYAISKKETSKNVFGAAVLPDGNLKMAKSTYDIKMKTLTIEVSKLTPLAVAYGNTKISVKVNTSTLYKDITAKKSTNIKVVLPILETKSKVIFKSLNPKIVTVNKSGKITAKNPGKGKISVTITLTDGSKKKYSINMNVKKK